jgi:5-formyltetrahydrofolate cyclo-ligase
VGGVSPSDPDVVAADKVSLRERLLAARRRRRPADLVDSATAIAQRLLATPEVRRAAVVAAYVSVGSEPGTGPLLQALAEAGTRVLLPVLRRDRDLDWAPYEGPAALASARLGLLEPTTARLGRDAVAGADVLLCPGLAVDGAGRRLGRGGGSYDRVLARAAPGTFSCVLLYPEEVLDAVPFAVDDRPVGAVATPQGVRRFDRSLGRAAAD